MQRECALVEQEWDGMIPALKARKFDAIVASMSITEERKRQIDFSDKYYQTPARLVAPKNAGFEGMPEGLAGKRIGVQRGATHQCYAEKMFPDAEIVLYGSQEEVFRDLALGRIDAQLSDSLIAQEAFLNKEEGADYAFLGGDHLDVECYGEGVGIAVRKGDDELRDALSAAISTIRENGTYAEINGKYFPFDIYGGRPESADAATN
jgi:polar amino acid transport system substrate-binding protein/arginine/ornithine transport system substrate-binding protein